MSAKPSNAAVRAWVELTKAQQIVQAHIEGALASAGLPPLVWYDVLLEVERAGDKGLRPFELERAMLLAQYNLSRLVGRIEEAGHVERKACEDDGRGHLIAITEQGKAVRRKMWPIYAAALEVAVGKPLSVQKARQLTDLLRLLTQRGQKRA